MLSVREGSGDHPDARQVRASVLRSLQLPKKAGLRRSLLSTTRAVERRTEAGVVLGKGLAYTVDLSRLDRVVKRVVKGMFYMDNRRPLPFDYEALVYSEDGLGRLASAEREKLHSVLIQPALSSPGREIGNAVMRYWSTYADDDPNVSGWLFEFYGHVRFYGMTLPASVV